MTENLGKDTFSRVTDKPGIEMTRRPLRSEHGLPITKITIHCGGAGGHSPP